MKLKPNCIRDLLEVFESEIQDANCTYNFPSWESFQEYPALEKYTVEEIAYHCQQLYLSGFFYHGELYCDGGMSLMISCRKLTPYWLISEFPKPSSYFKNSLAFLAAPA